MAGTYSAVITALAARLDASTATGKVLAGAKFYAWPQATEEGQRDFPTIRMFPADIDEKPVLRAPVHGAVTVRLQVATQRTLGIPESLLWVEKMLDAIEVEPTTGLVDVRLAGTLRAPIEVTGEGSHPTELSINANVIITLIPAKVPQRGKRRL